MTKKCLTTAMLAALMAGNTCQGRPVLAHENTFEESSSIQAESGDGLEAEQTGSLNIANSSEEIQAALEEWLKEDHTELQKMLVENNLESAETSSAEFLKTAEETIAPYMVQDLGQLETLGFLLSFNDFDGAMVLARGINSGQVNLNDPKLAGKYRSEDCRILESEHQKALKNKGEIQYSSRLFIFQGAGNAGSTGQTCLPEKIKKAAKKKRTCLEKCSSQVQVYRF